MFSAELAESLKVDAGKKYKPSNGTEGEIFMSRFCHQCKRIDEPCPILGRVFFGKEVDEWAISKHGHPECTAFDEVDTLNQSKG